ncbi:MAG: lytic transglycosylase F [Deltaproteobacteria bacterium]|nr:lytic transglycosylase F [Deltaproteobacteria bacterium]
MIQFQHHQWNAVSGRRVSSALLVAIIALTVAVPLMAQAADSKPAQGAAMLENKPWIGDFDKMAEKRRIRVLVAFSKTFYFLDRGRQRGISYDLLKEFEKFVNQKLKTKTLKVTMVFIPVRRDELIPGLVKGLGDMAVANLTITPQRLKHVDFGDPLLSGVKELLVSGPAAPPVKKVGDLAGQEIHVRKSSSYYASLVELNGSFKKTGKPAIKLIAADETFEDEDLLELVNVGIIPMIVMDSHKAQFWTQIFDKIQVNPEISVRTGGEIARALRKNSPQLKAVINEFVKGHKKGTLLGNMLLKRYLKSTKYMRFIVNRYYKDEPMDDLNKMLFAFASYNAGAAKVNRLRKKAAAMGLDPNVWFDNVEIAAAQVIGRETVQYVSNIYKYYIAYKLVIDQRDKKQKLINRKSG